MRRKFRRAAIAFFLSSGLGAAAFSGGDAPACPAEGTPARDDVIVLRGPTLIAFSPAARRDAKTAPELVEILDDFHLHLENARPALEAAGVTIHERAAGEIRVRDGGRLRVIGPPPAGEDLGYYMVRPGREPGLVLGVYTDVDLVQAAGRHLGLRDSGAGPAGGEIPYTVENGALRVFGHSLEPALAIRLPESPEDEDRSAISFSPSGDGRWIVIEHHRDVNHSEYWLYDSRTGKEPFHIPGGSGRHGRVLWHGDDLFEIRFTGMGYTVSRFVRVESPGRPFLVTDLLYCDASERIYVALVRDGVEIAPLFMDAPAKERFPIALDYESSVDALMAIDSVTIEGDSLVVVHTRRDGSLARERFHPKILERSTSPRRDGPGRCR